ncbi:MULTISPECIES: T6SS immunity protein Tdi1 domain-containing protein [unclassified Pseudarthrobacter]|uniref:T6SS immunity protein Tdi1 domain-containing protein n=1 Tax=unclassified Pseudarthrobacter TaxID=2647000 RepID=UPI0036434664
MFELFADGFTATSREPHPNTSVAAPGILTGLFNTYGGTTFDGGIYRIHDAVSSKAASKTAAEAYPGFQTETFCFGFDWLGRQFALDFHRGTPDDPEVILLEPGTGEALEIPVPFSKFHDDALFEYRDSCLFPDWFAEWRAAGGAAPAFTECIGYKQPLFLGGEDTTANLQLTDIDVYWSIAGQVLNATRHLPDGTPVSHLGMAT